MNSVCGKTKKGTMDSPGYAFLWWFGFFFPLLYTLLCIQGVSIFVISVNVNFFIFFFVGGGSIYLLALYLLSLCLLSLRENRREARWMEEERASRVLF